MIFIFPVPNNESSCIKLVGIPLIDHYIKNNRVRHTWMDFLFSTHFFALLPSVLSRWRELSLPERILEGIFQISPFQICTKHIPTSDTSESEISMENHLTTLFSPQLSFNLWEWTLVSISVRFRQNNLNSNFEFSFRDVFDYSFNVCE